MTINECFKCGEKYPDGVQHRHNLMYRAGEAGWTYIHTNAIKKLVGIPPPPASNQEFIEITEEELES